MTLRTKCECGSFEFVTTMNILVHDVPVRIKPNGDLWYDDLKGNSDGWDVASEPEVVCRICGHIYSMEPLPDQSSKYGLKDMQAAAKEPEPACVRNPESVLAEKPADSTVPERDCRPGI